MREKPEFTAPVLLAAQGLVQELATWILPGLSTAGWRAIIVKSKPIKKLSFIGNPSIITCGGGTEINIYTHHQLS